MEKVIQIRFSEEEYENLEEMSMEENEGVEDFIRTIIRKMIDQRAKEMEEEFLRDRDKFIKLEDYIKSRG